RPLPRSALARERFGDRRGSGFRERGAREDRPRAARTLLVGVLLGGGGRVGVGILPLCLRSLVPSGLVPFVLTGLAPLVRSGLVLLQIGLLRASLLRFGLLGPC